MGEYRETTIFRPGTPFVPGDRIGRVDAEGIVYDSEGELGYIDAEGQIRLPRHLLGAGEIVARIEEGRAFSRGGLLTPARELGRLDERGRVVRTQKGLPVGEEVVGQGRGRHLEGALAYHVLRFYRLERECNDLVSEVLQAQDKVRYLRPVDSLTARITHSDVLGDLDRLVGRLDEARNAIREQIESRRIEKEKLCRRAEGLSQSSDWRGAAAELRDLREEWQQIGRAGPDLDDLLWERLNKANDVFYGRRRAWYERNRREKAELCHRAEELRDSSEWHETAIIMLALMQNWKTIGFAGPDADEHLWQRFHSAQGHFFDRRREHFRKLDEEREANYRRKERLCREAEALARSSDLAAARERAKELQAIWKTIGRVPRDKGDSQWHRFCAACDEVFDRSRAEWQAGLEEALERKRAQAQWLRESIEHDEGLVERWEEVIDSLLPGGRAEEIREDLEAKIADVQEKLARKGCHLDESERVIADMEINLVSGG